MSRLIISGMFVVVLAIAGCKHTGAGSDPIPTEPRSCGGIVDAQCGKSEICKLETGQCNTQADPIGICKAKPDICTEHIEWVCGCDGVNYTNECHAEMSGVNVAYEGKCVTSSS